MTRLRNRWSAWKQRRDAARREKWFGLGSCGCVVAWIVDDPATEGPPLTPQVQEALRRGLEVPVAWVKVRGDVRAMPLSPFLNHTMTEGEERTQKSAHGGVVTTKAPDRLGGPDTCTREALTMEVAALYVPAQHD